MTFDKDERIADIKSNYEKGDISKKDAIKEVWTTQSEGLKKAYETVSDWKVKP